MNLSKLQALLGALSLLATIAGLRWRGPWTASILVLAAVILLLAFPEERRRGWAWVTSVVNRGRRFEKRARALLALVAGAAFLVWVVQTVLDFVRPSSPRPHRLTIIDDATGKVAEGLEVFGDGVEVVGKDGFELPLPIREQYTFRDRMGVILVLHRRSLDLGSPHSIVNLSELRPIGREHAESRHD